MYSIIQYISEMLRSDKNVQYFPKYKHKPLSPSRRNAPLQLPDPSPYLMLRYICMLPKILQVCLLTPHGTILQITLFFIFINLNLYGKLSYMQLGVVQTKVLPFDYIGSYWLDLIHFC